VRVRYRRPDVTPQGQSIEQRVEAVLERHVAVMTQAHRQHSPHDRVAVQREGGDIIEAPGAGWTAPETFMRLGAGLGLMGVFALWELHNSAPMFDIRLFTRPNFGATSLAETVAHFALVGGTFALTQYQQFVRGQRPLAAGISMLPIAVGVILGSVIAARLRLRIDGKYLIAAGISGISISLLLIARLAVDSPYVAFAAVLVFMSLGMGLAMAPATDLIMGVGDKARAGVGSATNDATRELGSALGVAVFGGIVSSGYRAVLAGPIAGLPGGVAACLRR
jgi:hypothetical protein